MAKETLATRLANALGEPPGRQKVLQQGEAALHDLMGFAEGCTRQGRVIAAFLLGLYDGERFKFDLTDFRCLDTALFARCQAVLAMDSQPEKEVHCYFEDGNRRFEALATAWGIGPQ